MTTPPKGKLTGTLRMVSEPELIYRLFFDSRVNFLLKLLPIAAIVYLISPDPIPGPFDDAIVMWILSWLFIQWSPKDVVRELRGLPPLQPKPPTPQKPPVIRVNTRKPAASESVSPDDDDVIDAQFRDLGPKE